MSERILKANGITLWTESFGDPNGIPLLLIMGASAQGLYWPDGLVRRLVDRGRFVIRYDNRDTGQSTCFDFAENPYTLDDMTKDAVGVLDGYGLESAHVAGASMGGMIVQQLAIQHRPRLRSATIIMSTPLASNPEEPGMGSADLPPPDPDWLAKTFAIIASPAETREQRIQLRIDTFRQMAGSIEPFNEQRQRDIATREVDRAPNFEAMNNHTPAIMASSPRDRRPLLAKLDIPTLVVHGTEDPILAYPHGVALAEAIPGAELMTLEGAGHEMPDCYLDEMVRRMVAMQDAAAP